MACVVGFFSIALHLSHTALQSAACRNPLAYMASDSTLECGATVFVSVHRPGHLVHAAEHQPLPKLFVHAVMGQPEDINATGQPDTPLEVVNDLLAKSLKAASADEMKGLVEQAFRVSNGLDPYLDRMLSPVPQACRDLIDASASHNWAQVHEQVRHIAVALHHCNNL